MAAITCNTAGAAHRAEQSRDRLGAVVAVLRDMLDAFVSYRIRLAAAEAEHARPRPEASSPLTNGR
jgi:hypothetical protein